MLLLSFLILLFPHQIDFDNYNQIVIWNIGQGQWITSINKSSCYHFDAGGEFFSSKKISQACAKKENYILFSHWDWDHIGLANQLKNSVKKICISSPPIGKAKLYKVTFLKKIPYCVQTLPMIKKLNFSYHKAKKDNDLSQVFIFDQNFLIPGDSTRKMEAIWSSQLKNKKIKWLSVSHHGSNTSTSEEFLKNIPNIGQAIVSARKKAYGHPHKSVIKRLKKYNIPLVKTEDWGNIRIILN